MSFTLDPGKFLIQDPQQQQKASTPVKEKEQMPMMTSPLAQITNHQNLHTSPSHKSPCKNGDMGTKKEGSHKKGEKVIILRSGAKSAIKGKRIGKKIQNEKHTSTQQMDKLVDITSRCIEYYNKFNEEKQVEVGVVRQAFRDINNSLKEAFTGIINEVQEKYDQIAYFLTKKQLQLVQIKEKQEKQLKKNLQNIKSVHLTNLLDEYHSGDRKNEENNNEFGCYAYTLENFYQVMEGIQNFNYKQNVDQTINFINNLITEELKFMVYDRIPHKSANCSFSFNEAHPISNPIHHQPDPSIVSSTFEIEEKKLDLIAKGEKLLAVDCGIQTVGPKNYKVGSFIHEAAQIYNSQDQRGKRIDFYSHFL